MAKGFAVIEWTRVSELRDEVGEEDFGEVVDLFLEEVEEVIARLRGVPDPAKLESDLHFLKGSALNLGFAHFSSLCQDGETASASGRAGEVDIGAIIAGFETSRAAFQSGLPKHLPP